MRSVKVGFKGDWKNWFLQTCKGQPQCTSGASKVSESPSVVSDSFAIPWTTQSMDFSRPFPSPGDLPNPGIEPGSPALQADSLPAESPGEPRNTGVGSLFLLQGIFPTQEWNQGLLHCRQILYQLSYQEVLLKTKGLPWQLRG